ncbi:MAG: DUF6624 domain-containing protein [Alteripontixanthobacter sp.]
MRGAFPDASEEEQADYEAIKAWLDQCHDRDREEMKARLAAMGIADPALEVGAYAARTCGPLVPSIDHTSFDNYADLEAHLASTRPIFDAMLATADLSGRIGGPASDELGELLKHRIIREQIYRFAYSWLSRGEKAARIPDMTLTQRIVFAALLRHELTQVDAANTAWLKDIVEESGWPTISAVGKKASSSAWLLVQHADHDPAFQLEILRMLEPLAEQGEVSRRNYAYLYDRVTLKLEGKQRYATQMWCVDGMMEPRPLEDPARIDELRTYADLEPLSEYQ